ncbi:MAG: hypothetical protein WC516_02215 [Patescibacteria group bacterium]
MTDEVSRTKEIAARAMRFALGPAFSPAKNAWDTLRSIPWKELCTGSFSQDDMAAMNLVLDPRSCLGRVALMIAVVEKYFPELMPQVRCAEVTSDFFRGLMLKQWGTVYSPDNLPPEGWVEELLMYEEPHAILVIDGRQDDRQFDPLFCVYAEKANCPVDDLAHPAVCEFSPWEAVTTFRLVSEAFWESKPAEQLRLLREADSICPGTCLVMHNMVGPLMLLCSEGDAAKGEEAQRLLERICDLSPNVRALTCLRHFFGPSHQARDGYDPYLLALLEAVTWRSVL